MADPSQIKTAEAAPAVKKPNDSLPVKPARFNINELRAHSHDLFKVYPEIFDGAFFGAAGTFSKDEAQDKIKTFLAKKSFDSKKKTEVR